MLGDTRYKRQTGGDALNPSSPRIESDPRSDSPRQKSDSHISSPQCESLVQFGMSDSIFSITAASVGFVLGGNIATSVPFASTRYF